MKDPSATSRDLIRVLVADSNQTQSQLLSSALRRQPGLKITCCGSELSDCLQALRSAPADILLLGDGPSDHDCLIKLCVICTQTIRGSVSFFYWIVMIAILS
jgi:hypothetical protein